MRGGIGQQETQDRSLEKFNWTAEAAVGRIESRHAGAIYRRDIQWRRRFPSRGSTPHFFNDYFAFVGESRSQTPQVHLDIRRRNIDRPRENAPIRQRRNQRWPPSSVVMPGYIRAREGINPHRDENLFH